MKTLRVGQKVQLEFNISSSEKMQIMCNIQKIETDRLILKYPDQLMKFSEYLTEGTEIRAFVFTEANIQVLDSIIITAPYDENFEIEYPEDYRTIQRRAYIRESLIYKIILQNDKITAKGISIDMGGGGFRFTTEEKLEPDSYMSIWINIDENLPSIKCQGKLSKKPHFKENEYLVEFTEISERDRNQIIKQCIQKQVKELRK